MSVSLRLGRELPVYLAVVVGVVVLVLVGSVGKVAFYLEALERSGVVYALPLAAVVGLLVTLAYPRSSLFALAFLLPFNFVGGVWGSSLPVLVAKMGVNLLTAAALLAALVAPAAQRRWLLGTRLGLALLGWLAATIVAAIIGLLSASNPEYWIRESGWMLLFLAAIPYGTLLRDRRDIVRLLWSLCAGVALLQGYAFWTLVTGTRYERADAWEGGATFFRAPYSCVNLLALYLAVAVFLHGSSQRRLSSRTSILLLGGIAALGGGLLARMVRSLWLTGAIGLAAVVLRGPRDPRTAKALVGLAGGALLALLVVAGVDRLSPSSSHNWTAGAVTFLADLGSSRSTSRVTREIEWGHAVDVWLKSPVVGLGWGYSYPLVTYGAVTGAPVTDTFYIHNSYLNVLAKTGLFGLAAFVLVLWSTIATANEIAGSPAATLFERNVATACFAAMIALALLTSVAPVLTSGDPAAYCGMLIGIVVALRRSHLAQPAVAQR